MNTTGGPRTSFAHWEWIRMIFNSLSMVIKCQTKLFSVKEITSRLLTMNVWHCNICCRCRWEIIKLLDRNIISLRTAEKKARKKISWCQNRVLFQVEKGKTGNLEKTGLMLMNQRPRLIKHFTATNPGRENYPRRLFTASQVAVEAAWSSQCSLRSNNNSQRQMFGHFLQGLAQMTLQFMDPIM